MTVPPCIQLLLYWATELSGATKTGWLKMSARPTAWPWAGKNCWFLGQSHV